MLINPYENLEESILQSTSTHEHICTDVRKGGNGPAWSQSALEKMVNRGIDVICGVNYTPAVPTYPLQGFNYTYKARASWDDLTIVDKQFSSSYSDFTKANGDICRLSEVVQLPNAEHAWFRMPDGNVITPLHICIVGNMYGEPCSETPDGAPEGADLAAWRIANSLGTWGEFFRNAKANTYRNMGLFGTINHPGWSKLTYQQAEAILDVAKNVGDVIHAMEIHLNGDTVAQVAHNEELFDRLLTNGHKLNCVSVVDWQRSSDTIAPDKYNQELDEKGRIMLLLPRDYFSLSYSDKQACVMEALRGGKFYSCGTGAIKISKVSVSGNTATIKFNMVCDSIKAVIDGVAYRASKTDTMTVSIKGRNRYVRFVAYKGYDYLYTNPFFNDRPSSRKSSIILFD